MLYTSRENIDMSKSHNLLAVREIQYTVLAKMSVAWTQLYLKKVFEHIYFDQKSQYFRRAPQQNAT